MTQARVVLLIGGKARVVWKTLEALAKAEQEYRKENDRCSESETKAKGTR